MSPNFFGFGWVQFAMWRSFNDTSYASCLQLRNLVWATSKHDVYLISNDSLMHWSSISRNLSEVLNFSGRIVPTEVIEKYLVMGPLLCFALLWLLSLLLCVI